MEGATADKVALLCSTISDIAKSFKQKCNMTLRYKVMRQGDVSYTGRAWEGDRDVLMMRPQPSKNLNEPGKFHMDISRQVKQHVQGPETRICPVSLRSS